MESELPLLWVARAAVVVCQTADAAVPQLFGADPSKRAG
jgi:hypothetical protein